jgi:thiol:disulfide interchange protein
MNPHIFGLVYLASIVAQATPITTNWWEPLIAGGPITAVLAWFMLRSEKKTNEQTAAINNMAVMLATTILELKHGDAAIAELAARCKEQAERLQKHENSSG